MKFKDRALLLLATGGGLGYIPFAPGTFGSLPGIAIAYVLSRWPLLVSVAAVGVMIVCAIRIAHQGEKLLGREDPGAIVIDEIAGMTVTLIGLPFNFFTAAGGFLVFRILDITKPFPAKALERNLKGGTAVVMDDIAAGIYGNLLLRVALYLLDMR